MTRRNLPIGMLYHSNQYRCICCGWLDCSAPSVLIRSSPIANTSLLLVQVFLRVMMTSVCCVAGTDTKPSDVDGQPYSTLLYGSGPGYSVPRNVPNNASSAAEERNAVHGASVPRQWATHGGEDVPVFAAGPLSRSLFSGIVDQSYIPHAIAFIGKW